MDPAVHAHIISRIQADIEFLASHNQISRADVSAIMSKLSTASPTTSHTAARAPASFPPPAGPPPPTSNAVQAKALWSYNENGQESNDLSFSAGDIIEIIDEANEDWWTGRKVTPNETSSKQALFPSSYVEKLPAAPARTLPPMYTGSSANSQPSGSEKPVYRPFMAAHHDAPPPGAVNSVGLQQDAEGQEKKKSKYGKYGNTFAHSAVGGVGLGAGSAIGGGLVRAIF